MFDPLAGLNPKFEFFSPAHSDLDDSDKITEHVDHAIIALDGRAPLAGSSAIDLFRPVRAGVVMKIELWVNDLDDVTCTYGFLATSDDGHVPYARGERTVVNMDPATHRLEKWSNEFRSAHEALLKDLPAYA